MGRPEGGDRGRYPAQANGGSISGPRVGVTSSKYDFSSVVTQYAARLGLWFKWPEERISGYRYVAAGVNGAALRHVYGCSVQQPHPSSGNPIPNVVLGGFFPFFSYEAQLASQPSLF